MNLTVIIPVWGVFDPRYVAAAVDSLLLQSSDLQVIVSEVSPIPRCKSALLNKKVTYLYQNTLGIIPLGTARNIALKEVNTEYVYFSDADICYLANDFFVRLLQNHNEGTWIQPKMRRIPINETEEFFSSVCKIGLKNTLDRLKHPNDYISTINAITYHLVVDNKPNLAHRINQHAPMSAIFEDARKHQERGEKWKYLYWHDTIHRGGIFTSTSNARRVGGYCTEYIGYGYEDDDLIYKLSHISTIHLLNETNLEVLHIDHSKSKYFHPSITKRNRQLFNKRLEQNPQDIIEADREVCYGRNKARYPVSTEWHYRSRKGD